MTSKLELSTRVYNQPILVAEQTASDFAQAYPDARELELATNEYAFGQFDAQIESVERRKPFAFVDGLAIITAYGFLEHRSLWAGAYYTGYESIIARLEAAVNDDDVKGIMLDIDSTGGTVAGCFECAAKIRQARGTKPITARVYPQALSAAYAIASAADRILVSPTGAVGSVGVVLLHMDHSEQMKQAGVKPTFVFAGAHKVDGNPYEPLKGAVKADMQERIDAMYDVFVGTVAQNRGLDADVVRGTEARVYSSQSAVEIGLADGIMPAEEVIASLLHELNGSNYEDITMSNEVNEPVGKSDEAIAQEQAAAVAAALKTEKARMSAILGSEEAKGREDQAMAFVTETDLSAEQAIALLGKAPVREKAEVGAGSSSFEAAMSEGNPEAGAEPEAPQEKSELASVVALWDRAQGRK